MVKTFDEKISSPNMKSPSQFISSTPTREPNPHRPKKQSLKNKIVSVRASEPNGLKSEQKAKMNNSKKVPGLDLS